MIKKEVTIRSSIIRAALEDEGLVSWYLQGGKLEQTDSMLTGSITHCLILEPEKFDEMFTVVDTQRRGTKEWKLAEESKKTPVKRDLYNKCLKIKEAFWENINNGDYSQVKDVLINGVKEEWLQIKGSRNDVSFSIKPDVYTKDTLIDYKTTSRKSVTPFQWAEIVNEYAYDVQVVFYMNMLNTIKGSEGVNIKNIYHIVQSTEPPYCLSVFFFHLDCMTLSLQRMYTGIQCVVDTLDSLGKAKSVSVVKKIDEKPLIDDYNGEFKDFI